jgi:hypothetical protein
MFSLILRSHKYEEAILAGHSPGRIAFLSYFLMKQMNRIYAELHK